MEDIRLVKIANPGRLLFAISIAAFGIENLILAHNVGAFTRIIPWLPGVPLLAYLMGMAFLISGICMAVKLRTRQAAILLGILFLLCEICLQIPRAVASPMDLSLRTVVFEVFSLCAAALLLAGIPPERTGFLVSWPGMRSSLIVSGRVLLAVSSVLFGTSHFLVPSFIASLIPPWIPGSGLFWAYFTGIALIAAGVSIATNWMSSWAAAMLGAMFLLWFLLLHLPRILSYPRSHDPAEWSSAFIALGLCGGSWIAATALCERRNAFAEGSI